eukprot:5857376-Pyramimonas_sp.AAC.2
MHHQRPARRGGHEGIGCARLPQDVPLPLPLAPALSGKLMTLHTCRTHTQRPTITWCVRTP